MAAVPLAPPIFTYTLPQPLRKQVITMTQAPVENADSLTKLLNIMSQLRDPTNGCPWDRKQTWQSLYSFTLEEVYEVGAAIDANDAIELCDELGDLLFQIVFYSQIAKEQDLFDFNAVAESICNKMIRRHPHVFSGKHYTSEAEQKADWEAIKQQERSQKASAEASSQNHFADILQSQPALMRAVKLKKRSAKFGFDWHDWQPVAEKVREELEEVIECLNENQGPKRVEEEIGDLLLSVANLAHQVKVEPENALRKANNKFEKRVNRLREILAIDGDQADHDDATLDRAWQQVKAEELRRST